MTYRNSHAEELLGEIRRWDVNVWDRRDVNADVYWKARGGPDATRFQRAQQAVDRAAERGDSNAEEARNFLGESATKLEQYARSAVERLAGEELDDHYFERWCLYAKQAALQALASEVARPWISAEDAKVLCAGLRAADERLVRVYARNSGPGDVGCRGRVCKGSISRLSRR